MTTVAPMPSIFSSKDLQDWADIQRLFDFEVPLPCFDSQCDNSADWRTFWRSPAGCTALVYHFCTTHWNVIMRKMAHLGPNDRIICPHRPSHDIHYIRKEPV